MLFFALHVPSRDGCTRTELVTYKFGTGALVVANSYDCFSTCIVNLCSGRKACMDGKRSCPTGLWVVCRLHLIPSSVDIWMEIKTPCIEISLTEHVTLLMYLCRKFLYAQAICSPQTHQQLRLIPDRSNTLWRCWSPASSSWELHITHTTTGFTEWNYAATN